ncbi:MAG: hypothetical protein ACYDCO_21775 [Armatimonadota bacterium]
MPAPHIAPAPEPIKAFADAVVNIDGAFTVNADEAGTEATAVEQPAAPNATFTLLDKTPTANAVIGKLRNDGPDAAIAEIIVVVEKDGKAAGSRVRAVRQAGQGEGQPSSCPGSRLCKR